MPFLPRTPRLEGEGGSVVLRILGHQPRKWDRRYQDHDGGDAQRTRDCGDEHKDSLERGS